eukprot:TRINITY_DN1221_c0_g1_i1.p1 TRINITY_DN1221_c0_g1~~TRINITY_DN1221_c0_g1_i1.p1  ORF type:complete len:469 (+),score=52.63 TRINITY_DN1221_c0_g1_i1:311-1717(+)
MVKKILSYGTSPDLLSLQIAAQEGDLIILHYLLEQGQDLKKTDSYGRTALWSAVIHNRTSALAFLITKGAKVRFVDTRGRTLLHWSALLGYYQVSMVLINQARDLLIVTDKDGNTPLHLAAANGHVDVAKLFIHNKASRDKENKQGYSPFSLAASRGHNEFKGLQNFSMKPNMNLNGHHHHGDPMTSQPSAREIRKSTLRKVGASGIQRYIVLLFLFLIFYAHSVVYFVFFPNIGSSSFWFQASAVCLWLSFLFSLIAYWKACSQDPGYLPKSDDPSEDLDLETGSLDDHDDSNRLPKKCKVCNVIKPPRTKHCPFCDRCVEKYQHHCTWTNNCVGRKNYPAFYAFLVFLSIDIILVVSYATLYAYWTTDWQQEEGGFRKLWHLTTGHLNFTLVTIMSVGLGISGLGLALSHSVLIALNLTSHEAAMGCKYPYLRTSSGQYHNRFSEGLLLNILDFLKVRSVNYHHLT